MAAELRAALPTFNRDGLVLERSALSKTGFVNIIEVKGKFQARLQVPGDGAKKRKQQALPGLFDSAEDAAVYLAMCKQDIAKKGWSTGEGAAKIDPIDKKHKPRTPKQPAAAVPSLPQPVTTTVGMPIAMPMPCLAFVPALPLPMQPLGYFPLRAWFCYMIHRRCTLICINMYNRVIFSITIAKSCFAFRQVMLYSSLVQP